MGVFCCHGNQTKRQIGRLLAIFNCPYPFNICTKLEFYCFRSFQGVVIKKKKKFKLNVAMTTYKTVTGHKTHKLGRHSSNDQNCQIWFTSLQWLWRKCKWQMGVFSCHGNQTTRQIGRLLAIFNCPYPSNICTKLKSYCLSGFGGVVIQKKQTLAFKFNVAMVTKQNGHWS